LGSFSPRAGGRDRPRACRPAGLGVVHLLHAVSPRESCLLGRLSRHCSHESTKYMPVLRRTAPRVRQRHEGLCASCLQQRADVRAVLNKKQRRDARVGRGGRGDGQMVFRQAWPGTAVGSTDEYGAGTPMQVAEPRWKLWRQTRVHTRARSGRPDCSGARCFCDSPPTLWPSRRPSWVRNQTLLRHQS